MVEYDRQISTIWMKNQRNKLDEIDNLRQDNTG